MTVYTRNGEVRGERRLRTGPGSPRWTWVGGDLALTGSGSGQGWTKVENQEVRDGQEGRDLQTGCGGSIEPPPNQKDEEGEASAPSRETRSGFERAAEDVRTTNNHEQKVRTLPSQPRAFDEEDHRRKEAINSDRQNCVAVRQLLTAPA